MGDLIIRSATIDDLLNIQKLNKILFELEYNNFDSTLDTSWPMSNEGEEYFKNAINNNIVLVAVLDDKIVGYLVGSLNIGKKIYDNSYGMFINKLGYKLEQSNKTLLKVDRYFPSSKLCSKCGNMKNDLKLSDRTYTCNCGNIIDRDYNASLNIAMEGIKILAEQAITINI